MREMDRIEESACVLLPSKAVGSEISAKRCKKDIEGTWETEYHCYHGMPL